MDCTPRKRLGRLVYTWSALVLLQVASLVFSSVAISNNFRDNLVPFGIVVVQWLILASSFALTVGFSSLFGKANILVSFLGWLAGRGGTNPDMLEVKFHLHNFMSDSPATTSDVAASMVLLMRCQTAVRRGQKIPRLSELHLDGFAWGEEEDRLLAKSCGGALPGTVPIADQFVLEDLLHNLCYATAVFGILLHIVSGRGSMHRTSASAGSATISQAAYERAVLATLAEWPGHESTQLVYLSTRNDVKLAVYAIFVNVERQEVTLSVRGTLSISDAITDVLATPKSLSDTAITGPASGPHYVHSGMWDCAETLLADLDRHQILSGLFTGSHATGPPRPREVDKKVTHRDLQDLPDCSGFTFTVVGHSLGAGIAQLLTALLRPRYPKIRCIGYGSPHVWSKELAEYMSPCMIQVVAGHDMIPRLSVRNAEFLRDYMLALIAHCPWSKNKIMSLGFGKHLLEFEPGCISSELVSMEAGDILEGLRDKKASPRFFHSGRICYLRVLNSRYRCFGAAWTDTAFQAEWAESDHFMEIVINPKMLLHHLPDNYRRALELSLEECRRSPAQRTQAQQEGNAASGAPLLPQAVQMAVLNSKDGEP